MTLRTTRSLSSATSIMSQAARYLPAVVRVLGKSANNNSIGFFRYFQTQGGKTFMIARIERWLKCAAAAVLLGLGLTPYANASTIYANDPTLSDFTSTVSSYGTFISGFDSALGNLSTSTTYTPTTAILLAANYPRVIGGAQIGSPVIVRFGSATSAILAFDNIDHLGFAWDVFQYKILGCTTTGSSCNSDTGSNYTALFDPQTVNEANNPGINQAFTLNGFSGTAPTVLNNTLTSGLGSIQGNIGYEEYFTFANSYSYFEFVPSTLTLNTGENELELSAVGIATPSQVILDTAAPEPVSALFVGAGLALLAAGRRWRKAAR
jgi:hypothetical protein